MKWSQLCGSTGDSNFQQSDFKQPSTARDLFFRRHLDGLYKSHLKHAEVLFKITCYLKST